MAASCSAGVRPSGGVSTTLPESCCLRPATRTMKNSSRFEATMEQNFSRSPSGTVGSRASSSTRSLKPSQDTSRLMNSFAAAGSLTTGGLPTTGFRARRATGGESSASSCYARVTRPGSWKPRSVRVGEEAGAALRPLEADLDGPAIAPVAVGTQPGALQDLLDEILE